jgi:uncharacterized protein YciI
MLKRALLVACGAMCLSMQAAAAQTAPAVPVPAYDAELAKSLGGNDNGLRSYVLVILKTGPNKVADVEERKKMFQGHFANMERLAAEKKLAFAGPLDGVEGRRGIFILATQDIEVAKTYVATDPVIVSGEMVAEYHKLYGSAALMMVNDLHNKIIRKK